MDRQDSFVHVRDGGYYKGMAQLPGVAGLSHYYSGASICRVKVFDVGSTPAIETRGVLLFFSLCSLEVQIDEDFDRDMEAMEYYYTEKAL